MTEDEWREAMLDEAHATRVAVQLVALIAFAGVVAAIVAVVNAA